MNNEKKHRSEDEITELLSKIDKEISEKGMGIKKTLQSLGISLGSYYKWKNERAHSVQERAHKRAFQYTKAERHEILDKIEQIKTETGQNIKQIAKSFGISNNTYYKWKKEREFPGSGFSLKKPKTYTPKLLTIDLDPVSESNSTHENIVIITGDAKRVNEALAHLAQISRSVR